MVTEFKYTRMAMKYIFSHGNSKKFHPILYFLLLIFFPSVLRSIRSAILKSYVSQLHDVPEILLITLSMPLVCRRLLKKISSLTGMLKLPLLNLQLINLSLSPT